MLNSVWLCYAIFQEKLAKNVNFLRGCYLLMGDRIMFNLFWKALLDFVKNETGIILSKKAKVKTF